MQCDEKRTKEIITEMTRLYNELLEVKAQIEEKNKELVSLLAFQSGINPNSINNKTEEGIELLKLLITEFEIKMTTIISLNELKSNNLKMNIPSSIKTDSKQPRFNIEVTEKEALEAITRHLNSNREITKLVNDEISNEKAVLR